MSLSAGRVVDQTSGGWSKRCSTVRGWWLGRRVLDLPLRAAVYRSPPVGGLDPHRCETYECFVIEPAVLLGERGIEIPLGKRWFFDEIDAARASAREWLARMDRARGVAGARAHVRHAEVLIDPATEAPTTQLHGPTLILDPMATGCALDDPADDWVGAHVALVLQ
jgi:hypothetical protein